jgi:hypothetical protein
VIETIHRLSNLPPKFRSITVDAFHSLRPEISGPIQKGFTDLSRGCSRRTKSCVKHVKSHLVTFLRSRNSHQPLIAIVLWLVDLDNAATQMAYLIDLRATLADDGPDHIVWNEYLLS